MDLTGAPKIVGEITNFSTLPGGAINGIIGVMGETERGVIGEGQLCINEIDYRKYFGGDLAGSDFPKLIKKALKSGAVLNIIRAGHYTDLSDKATLVATSATATINGKVGTVEVTAAGDDADVISVKDGTVEIASHAKTTGQSVDDIATALQIIIDALGGYGCTVSTDTITITKVANNLNLNISVTGNIAGTAVVSTDFKAVFSAKTEGPWAHGNLLLTITAAGSGKANAIDINEQIVGYPELTNNVFGVSETPTTDEKAAANALLKHCLIGTVTTKIPQGTHEAFSGGVYDETAVTDTDYVGNISGETGLYFFDNHFDIFRIAIPHKASPTIDVALAAYVDARQDLIGLIRTASGIDGDTVVDYREGTGAYSHVAIDSWRTVLITGGLKNTDANGDLENLPELPQVLSLLSQKDINKKYPWYSASGTKNKRGIIQDAKGVQYNFGAASKSTEWDKIYNKGVNAVIKDYDENLGNIVVLTGNRTLWKEPQLTQKWNVAELLVWLFRKAKTESKALQYDPNDPTMWKELYNNMRPIYKQILDNRGAYEIKHIGDQFVNDVSEVQYNDATEISEGKYKYRIMVKPTPAAEWIGFEVGVYNASVSFELIT